MPPMTKVWTGSAVRPRTSHPFNMLKLNWGNRTPPNHSPAIVATWVATKAAITALFPALLPIRYLTPESDSSISSPARGRLAILYNLSEGGDFCSASACPRGLRPLRIAAPPSGSTQPLYHRLPCVGRHDRRRESGPLHSRWIRPVFLGQDLSGLRSSHRRGLREGRGSGHGRRRRGRRRGAGSLRRTVERPRAEGSRTAPAEARTDDPRARGGPGPGRGEELRPSDPRRASIRSRADRRLVRIFRRHGDEGPRRRDPVLLQRGAELYAAGAARRRRPDRPLEFSPHVRRLEHRPGPRGGEYRRPETGRIHADERPRGGAALRRRGLSSGYNQCRPRKRLGGRREARPPSGRREDLRHRIRRRRTGHHPSRDRPLEGHAT